MMSEKEMDEGEELLLHYYNHEHPLTLVERSIQAFCGGCLRHFRSGEQRYGCSKKCGFIKALHRECAEMAMKIRHPMHPQHTLIQKIINYNYIDDDSSCGVCERSVWGAGYFCTSPECFFVIHIRCGQDMGVDDDDEQGRTCTILHESHPQHKLRWLSRSCSFKCDACGTTHKGSSYVCSLCDFWINERCASLEDTMKREDHPHSLSISFGVPREYIIDELKCDVCAKDLVPRYWVYHCRLCRYVVHLKCAFKKMPDYTKINYGEDIIRFPMAMNDVAEKLIRPFIMRQGGTIPPIPNEDVMVNAKYEFHSHEHHLTLISSSLGDENDENDNSDDDDDGKTSELICDGCFTPILKKNERSSNSTDKCYYMSCSECKYFLHYECFHLPYHLPYLPFRNANYPLILQSCRGQYFGMICDVCSLPSNGLFYTSKRDFFKVDIKCASLPNIIYHAAHPQHLINLFIGYLSTTFIISCASGYDEVQQHGYVCYDCEFIVYMKQLLLPTSTKNHKWDKKHMLMLTFDARLNHPDEFYCDQCETKMHPKMWMYHCGVCDLSFHPRCFPAASGEYRNIKFGQKYVNKAVHPHPLTYQLLTTKHRCDECLCDSYNKSGLHCASCNFFICLDNCNEKIFENGNIQTIEKDHYLSNF